MLNDDSQRSAPRNASAPSRVGRRIGIAALATLPIIAACAPPLDIRSLTIDDAAVGTSDNHVAYSGAWQTSGGAGKYANTDHFTATAGATTAIAFQGTSARILGAKAPYYGIAGFSIDGGPLKQLDLYSATRVDQVPIFQTGVLASGHHVVRMTAMGTHTAPATGSVVSIDRVDLTVTTSVPPQPAPAPTTSAPTPTPTGQVKLTRSGGQLFMGAKRYKFAGVNWDDAVNGCWSGDTTTAAEADQFFSQLNPHSMTRIWAMPGSNLGLLDQVVAAAGRHQQYVALTLFNGNRDCSSLPPPVYSGANSSEVNWVNTIVPRYANNPAIGFWEMINEPNGSDSGLRNFYSVISTRIKQLDPHTLVGTGSHALWSGGQAKYEADNNLATIDLLSMHEYDGNTGLSGWAGPTQTSAARLNKPWYAGEDGFCCGGGDLGSQAANAAKLKAEYDAYLLTPAMANSAGMLYWDFKLHYPASATISFGSPMWSTVSTYRHPYQ